MAPWACSLHLHVGPSEFCVKFRRPRTIVLYESTTRQATATTSLYISNHLEASWCVFFLKPHWWNLSGEQLQSLFNVWWQSCKLDACCMKVLQSMLSSLSAVKRHISQHICERNISSGQLHTFAFLEHSCQVGFCKHGIRSNSKCLHLIICREHIPQRSCRICSN